jgi:hypothetical protein
MTIRPALALVLALGAVAACGLAGMDATLGSGEKDANKCFVNTETDCVGDHGEFNGCCLKSATCGGKYYIGCPLNYCCNLGTDVDTLMGARRDGGAPSYPVVGAVRRP